MHAQQLRDLLHLGGHAADDPLERLGRQARLAGDLLQFRGRIAVAAVAEAGRPAQADRTPQQVDQLATLRADLVGVERLEVELDRLGEDPGQVPAREDAAAQLAVVVFQQRELGVDQRLLQRPGAQQRVLELGRRLLGQRDQADPVQDAQQPGVLGVDSAVLFGQQLAERGGGQAVVPELGQVGGVGAVVAGRQVVHAHQQGHVAHPVQPDAHQAFLQVARLVPGLQRGAVAQGQETGGHHVVAQDDAAQLVQIAFRIRGHAHDLGGDSRQAADFLHEIGDEVAGRCFHDPGIGRNRGEVRKNLRSGKDFSAR